MSLFRREPIKPPQGATYYPPHEPHPVRYQPPHEPHERPVSIRPANVDALIQMIQREFPNAGIRVTGGIRTVERQAQLMAQRRRQNRAQFISVYVPAAHITEMDNWVTTHPRATEAETVNAFIDIINRAVASGAVVSNHLGNHARDISIPIGTPAVRQQIRNRIIALGGHVIDEHDATGGPHWHVDYRN